MQQLASRTRLQFLRLVESHLQPHDDVHLVLVLSRWIGVLRS